MRVPLKRKQGREDSTNLNRLIGEAQNGRNDAREKLIRDYLPFILRVASKVTKRYLRPGEDDEVSVGMMAFNEAINEYDLQKGSSFLSFSEIVMRRRLTDYFRKEAHFRREIPMSSFQVERQEPEEGDIAEFLREQQATDNYLILSENRERKEEIFHFRDMLADYGISFSELVAASPKHEDARARAIEVAKVIVSDPKLRAQLVKKKGLPIKELHGRLRVSRKTLERQRKYILAVALILMGEFQHLRAYVDKL
ncbi:MAG TPA: RNA polymerase sigma-I factor [Firmicutes bacterium]|nr:RNA polymerase sigma-I factor [Bacillota bacterium]